MAIANDLQQDLSNMDAAAIDNFARQYFAMDDFEGFIQHPENSPIRVEILQGQELAMAQQTHYKHQPCTGIGLSFQSDEYIPPGNFIRMIIPAKLKEHTLVSRVVMVRNQPAFYTIGVWFDDTSAASYARNVEQICHLENFLREKHCLHGSRHSQDDATRQWIETFSQVFPTI